MRSLIFEQSEGNNQTNERNVFPVLHIIFFLLGGQKVNNTQYTILWSKLIKFDSTEDAPNDKRRCLHLAENGVHKELRKFPPTWRNPLITARTLAFYVEITSAFGLLYITSEVHHVNATPILLNSHLFLFALHFPSLYLHISSIEKHKRSKGLRYDCNGIRDASFELYHKFLWDECQYTYVSTCYMSL